MEYAPLDRSKAEIRLVELLPRGRSGSSTSEQPPRCNLIHASLDDNPYYSALSYAWGDPGDIRMITVGRNVVPVTRNLYSALEHLRYDETVKVIWVDALCINQSDNEEKSWQVQLMKDIYQRANFVSVWLGQADASSDKAIDFLRQFGTEAMKFGLDGGPGIVKMVRDQWKNLLSHPPSFCDRSKQRVAIKYENSDMDEKYFLMGDLNQFFYSISGSHEQNGLLPVDDLVNLFARTWWNRTWVLQELSVAQKAGFVCGKKWLSRRRCGAAVNTFMALRTVIQEMKVSKGAMLTSYQKSIADAMFDVSPIVLLSMWSTYRRGPFPLLALLRATCIGQFDNPMNSLRYHMEATDPRDKIYGVFGLAADRGELIEFGIQPDYTKSCEEVYISVAAAILRQGHLSVLSLNQFPKVRDGLPSWVPDWSQPLKSPLQATSPDHMTLEPQYKASGSLLQTGILFKNVEIRINALLSGFAYDEVYEAGATWAEFYPLKGFKDPIFLPAMRLLAEVVRLSFLRGKLYKSIHERIRAVARTVIAEVGMTNVGNWGRIGNQRYHIAASLLAIAVNDYDHAELLNAGFRELIKSEGLQRPIDLRLAGRYVGEIEAKARDRKPFVTVKGHLGLGPDHVAPGDVIAVLSGCQVPFVLRKRTGGAYELVGEAYVDGIMDGEAVVGRDALEVFELC